MEPFHQLQFATHEAPDWRSELRSLGYLIEEFAPPSWLGPRFPEFFDVRCRRLDSKPACFAVGEVSTSGGSITVFVYLHRLDDAVTKDIRGHLEALGAKWAYFDP